MTAMSFRSGLITGIVVTLLGCGVGTAAWWIATTPKTVDKTTKAAPAATVDRKVKEDELNVVTLTSAAEQSLKVETKPVERKRVPRARSYRGEIAVPAGQTIQVSAILGGLLKAPEGGVPLPGTKVKKGQIIVQLLPVLAPDARITLATATIDAAGQVETTQATFDGAKIALERAKKLVNATASQREVDNLQAQYDVAHQALEAAKKRKALLEKAAGEIGKGTAAPIPLEAPEEGLLRNVTALPGQNVPSGALLFEIVDLNRVWVRVPVYVGDVAEIAQADPAAIGGLAGKPGEPTRSAKPIPAPPSANPLAGTVDLYYEIDNRSADLLPGQLVGVTLPLRSEAESLVVPWSTVIHDINGGTWVYEQLAERKYARRRVVVQAVLGEQAVLTSGPTPGANLVTKGAAELYGVETGFSK